MPARAVQVKMCPHGLGPIPLIVAGALHTQAVSLQSFRAVIGKGGSDIEVVASISSMESRA